MNYTQRYSWNTTKYGVKHQINQTIYISLNVSFKDIWLIPFAINYIRLSGKCTPSSRPFWNYFDTLFSRAKINSRLRICNSLCWTPGKCTFSICHWCIRESIALVCRRLLVYLKEKYQTTIVRKTKYGWHEIELITLNCTTGHFIIKLKYFSNKKN